jgi:hypothetical protein
MLALKGVSKDAVLAVEAIAAKNEASRGSAIAEIPPPQFYF